MSISRYRNTQNVEFDYQNTFPSINQKQLESNDDFFYIIKDGDRLDLLAKNFYNDGRYWWVIAIANGINVPFGDYTKPGNIIRIPRNINFVITKL